MLIQSQAGALPSNRQSAGTPNNPGGIFGEALVSEIAPRYSSAAKNSKVFFASGALQTLSASGTAMTGLILWNSSSNTSGGVDLHLLKLTGNVAVTSASLTTIFLGKNAQATAPTTTTAAVLTNGYLSGGAGLGLAYTVGTVSAAPTAVLPVLHNTAAINTVGEDPGFYIDLEGSVVVPPGYYVAFYGNAASAASAVNLGISWTELPV